MSSVTDAREVQDLQCHPSKSCQHLLLWADTPRSTISCLFCVYQVGGEGTPWIPQEAPLCLPDPQHHLSGDTEAQQLNWVWLHLQQRGRGFSKGLKPLLDEPLAHGRRGTGLCQEPAQSPSPVHPHSCLQKYLLWLPFSGTYYCCCGG